MCIKNNYSARELNRQIASSYYQRYMLSNRTYSFLVALELKIYQFTYKSKTAIITKDEVKNERIN